MTTTTLVMNLERNSKRPEYRVGPVYSVEDRQEVERILASCNMGSASHCPHMVGLTILHWRLGADRLVACGGVYEISPNIHWIAHVAVKTNYRKMGLGREIVQNLCGSNRRTYWLETYFWNRKFYEKLGFEHVPIVDVPDEVALWRATPKCMVMRKPG